MGSLSKSVKVMFAFDLTIFSLSVYFWYEFYKLPFIYGIPIILTVLTGIAVLFLKSNYTIREFNINLKNIYLLFEGIVLAHIPCIAFLLFADGLTVEKFLISNVLTIFILLEAYRIFFHYYLFYLKKNKNILIIGTGTRVKVLADEIQNKKALRMNIAGFYKSDDNEEEIIPDSSIPIFEPDEKLADIIDKLNIDIVIITEALKCIIELPSNIELYKMPDFYEMATGKFYVDDKTIFELYYQFIKKQSLLYDFLKRVYDITASLIILIVTLPITASVALLVWLSDKKSPFYSQNRVGKGGKIFKCYKLRTMKINNYVPVNLKKGGYAKNQDEDDRVIPFCKFIRKARFDEIPQMINILKGDMSIVGPRAEWEEVVNIYQKEISYYNCRTWVQTGWTGWAQINQGHCINNDDIKEKLEYDLYYLKNRNILWEIGILVKAIFLALGGRHA